MISVKTGHLQTEMIFLREPKQLLLYGPSSAIGTQMEVLTNTRLDYVLTVDNKPGVKTIGILMHRSSHGIAYNYY